MSSQFYRYRLEYSNQRANGAYIRFERNNVDTGDYVLGPTISNNEWIGSDFPSCNGAYDSAASRCSELAPFDNPMNIVIDIGVGGDWCGEGVRAVDYDAFEAVGVEMEISSIDVVY